MEKYKIEFRMSGDTNFLSATGDYENCDDLTDTEVNARIKELEEENPEIEFRARLI